jgi:hypothetical protein
MPASVDLSAPQRNLMVVVLGALAYVLVQLALLLAGIPGAIRGTCRLHRPRQAPPTWMRRAGLEWLFWLAFEPRRLWRRS